MFKEVNLGCLQSLRNSLSLRQVTVEVDHKIRGGDIIDVPQASYYGRYACREERTGEALDTLGTRDLANRRRTAGQDRKPRLGEAPAKNLSRVEDATIGIGRVILCKQKLREKWESRVQQRMAAEVDDSKVTRNGQKGTLGRLVIAQHPRAREELRDPLFGRASAQSRQGRIKLAIKGRVSYDQRAPVCHSSKLAISAQTSSEDRGTWSNGGGVILRHIPARAAVAQKGEGESVQGAVGDEDNAAARWEEASHGSDENLIQRGRDFEELGMIALHRGPREPSYQRCQRACFDRQMLGLETRRAADPEVQTLPLEPVLDHHSVFG